MVMAFVLGISVYQPRPKAARIEIMNDESDFLGETNGSANDEQKPPEKGAVGSPEFIAELQRDAKKNRLPPELMQQILAEMPPPEEREQLYRELIENGGLSSEEFFASLGLEDEQQP